MKRLEGLGGRCMTSEELSSVEGAMGRVLPAELRTTLLSLAWIGLSAELDEDADASGFGVEMRVLTPKKMIAEFTDGEPGKTARGYGYLPIGQCLEGSADPYFVRLSDGAIVRIPHDVVAGGRLDSDDVDLVVNSITELVAKATWS